MAQSLFPILIVGFLFIACPIGAANAHTGHKKTPVMEEPAAQDSIYAVEGDETMTEGVDLPGSPLSRTNLFSDDASVAPLPMEPMDHSTAGPMEHKMPEVKLAEHEWVSTKQKGYGVAAGITILSGLVFGFLNFKRPSE